MIEWEDNLKVGIKLIDEQHQMLIQALQDIYDACSRGEGIKQLEHTMQFVLWYVDKHFKDEEDLQLRIDYPHYKLHKKIHDKYRQEVYEMMREFSKDELNIGKLSQMIEYLLRMIKTHIRQEDVRIAAFISNNAIGIDKKGQIEDAGAIDKLTGLLNKQAFDKQAEQVLKENAEKAVAYVSLQIDGFNRVNRSYGYDIGDELIICVSGILHQFERDNIKVARVHDDEFLMLIEEGEDNSLTKIVLEKIKLQVYEGLKREESIVPLSISSGVSFYPQDATTLKALAQRANIALAMAKEEGNNQIVFFEEKMYEESIYTAKVMQLLQPYHLNDFLKVVYQPIHDVKTNKVKGCETLLRLYNEEEVISPGYFIPLAEANDLIIDIGYFCIEKACKTYKELEEKNIAPDYISINLSVKQFKDNQLVSRIKEITQIYHMDTRHLYFEIVESTLINDFERAKEIIGALKALGCKVMLDDFGSGYSSLSYLSKVDADVIKIDKSFLDDIMNNMKAQIILQNMVQLVHDLDMVTVIEGVETEEEWRWIEQVNGDAIQGFLRSKPLGKQDLIRYLMK